MTNSEVYYTTCWNAVTRRPDPDHRWLNASAARQLYESHHGIDVIDAAVTDASDVPWPRWAIEFTGSEARVRFLDQHTALWRQVDYYAVDDRLWRHGTYDFTYPDDSKRWEQSDLMLKVESVVRPDGTGSLTILDKTECKPGTQLVSQYSGRAINAYWIDRPEFGDWAALTDPGPSAYEVAGEDAAVRAS